MLFCIPCAWDSRYRIHPDDGRDSSAPRSVKPESSRLYGFPPSRDCHVNFRSNASCRNLAVLSVNPCHLKEKSSKGLRSYSIPCLAILANLRREGLANVPKFGSEKVALYHTLPILSLAPTGTVTVRFVIYPPPTHPDEVPRKASH